MNRFDGFNTHNRAQKNDASLTTGNRTPMSGTLHIPVQTPLKDAIKKDFKPEQSNQPMSEQKQQKQQQQELQQQPQGSNQQSHSTTDQQEKRDHQKQQDQAEQQHSTQSGEKEKQNQQQQSQSLPKVAIVKAKWKQHVGDAKILWGKLTDNEILQSEGHADKLSALVIERYEISKQDADEQVEKFLTQCNY